MTILRRSRDRGHTQLGWLDSRHSFAFADYHDPAWVGFRSLRVLNEDVVAPGGGFPHHPHRDMEIFTYVVSGALEHADNLGNRRVLRPGDIQVMGAGRGIVHAEFNPSASDPAHFLQVWIRPVTPGLPPTYAEWRPAPGQAEASRVLLISREGREGSATLRQDADVHRLRLASGEACVHDLRPGRALWLQVVHGTARVAEHRLEPGDALGTDDAGAWKIEATGLFEALLFDLG